MNSNRQVGAILAVAAVAVLAASQAFAQCNGQCGPQCDGNCGPVYGTQYGQYGAELGARVTDRAPSRCAADGYCQPRRATWGYYQGQWRRWPVGAAATGPDHRRPMPPPGKPFIRPTPELEDLQTPTPAGPGFSRPAPTPAETPMPEAGATGSVLPAPPNPFAVEPSSLLEESDPNLNDGRPFSETRDPPPPLPSSLWSLRRANAADLSAKLKAMDLAAVAAPNQQRPIARLPTPDRQPVAAIASRAPTHGQHVIPAAAGLPNRVLVTADGLFDEEDDQVLPAVHFAPVEDRPSGEN